MRLVLLGLPALVLVCCRAGGEELHVPGAYPTVQAAIDAAGDGDEVVIAPGTYRELIDMSGKSITLRSTDPSDPEVVEATVLSGDLDSDGVGDGTVVLAIGEDHVFELRGLTITKGRATLGGGAVLAGAVHGTGFTLEMEHCVITDNSSENNVAGVAVLGSTGTVALIRGCAFVGNTAANAGGALGASGSVTVIDSVFRENSAGTEAGAIWQVSGGELTALGCRFILNHAGVAGGAMHATFAENTLVHCEFAANTAGEDGGSVYLFRSQARVDQCVFRASRAPRGAAVVTDSSVVTVSSSTIARDADSDSPSFFHTNQVPVPESLRLENVIVTGPGPSASAVAFSSGATVEVEHSLIAGGFPGAGNIDAAPLFVRPPSDGDDGWGDNPDTPGVDESLNDDFGDLRLMPGSPAVDAGDNTAVQPDEFDLDADGDTEEPTPLDLGGEPRFVDDPMTPNTGVGASPVVDMGAYEYQSPSCNTADFAPPFGVLDFDDVITFLQAFGAGDPVADLSPTYGVLDFNDVAIFLAVFVAGCP